MSRLLVIGGASIDRLHLKDRTVDFAGGAGLYNALAARRCGIEVTLFGPKPDPIPEVLNPASRLIQEWIGPRTPPDRMPRFEIAYPQGKVEYLQVFLDAERELSPSLLPSDLSRFDLIHVVPLEDACLQLSFIQACRQRGAKRISAGTWPRAAVQHPEAVREVLNHTDVAFMNEGEAEAVFGAIGSARTGAGKLLYITRGSQGACIVQGEAITLIPAVQSNEVDPTGAGDAFCGAALAFLLQNQHPILAGMLAARLAAEVIAQIGPGALMTEVRPPGLILDPRVRIVEGQVRKIAGQVSRYPEVSAFPFIGPTFPDVGDSHALEYFFAATLQQFGFWSERRNAYGLPLLAHLGGVARKGSDYLYEAYRRRTQLDPVFCAPGSQANLERSELEQVFRDDFGRDPMPALDLHLAQARAYGRDMLELGLTPRALLEDSLASSRPLLRLLSWLDRIGGYKEDPLRKKSSLLAACLSQRPERFVLKEDERISPIIDYHAMRLFLRTGLIEVLDHGLKARLSKRLRLENADEWAVRHAVYQAMDQVITCSGKSTGAVDQFFFFNARGHCFEMQDPDCPGCPLDSSCAHQKMLFQPVLRTCFY